MKHIDLVKKLTVLCCMVLCLAQVTACDRKALEEQAGELAQTAKDAAKEKVDAYLESCTESGEGRPTLEDEPEIYSQVVDEFFAAVDAGDKEKILGQFAPNVRKHDKDLEEKLDELLAFYPGPTDLCDREEGSPMMGSYTIDYGKYQCKIIDWFPVVSNGINYYCQLSYIYWDDKNPDNVGIEYVDMVSEKVICSEPFKWPEEPGIFVQTDAPGDYETRRIAYYPQIYVPVDRTLTREDVEEFLKTGGNFIDFQEQFGEPNVVESKYTSFAYELQDENGEKRYADFMVAHKKDWKILSVTVVNDTDNIPLDTLYRAPELDEK